MTFSFCLLITWIFWLSSRKCSFRNQRNSFYISKWSFLKCWTKKVQEFRHIYIYSIVNVTSAAIFVPISKNIYQSRQFATEISKVSTETRMAVVFCLIYCVNDFLTDFLRRLKSLDRLNGNENSMFRGPHGLFEETLVARRHNLGAPGVSTLTP